MSTRVLSIKLLFVFIYRGRQNKILEWARPPGPHLVTPMRQQLRVVEGRGVDTISLKCQWWRGGGWGFNTWSSNPGKGVFSVAPGHQIPSFS